MFQPLMGGGFRYEAVGVVTASSRGTTITANAAFGNDGAYTQLIASTSFDYDSILIEMGNNDNAASISIIDFAIGAGGAEKVVVADLPSFAIGNRYSPASLWLPLHIPKASAISARVHRSNANSSTINVSLIGCQGTPHGIPPFLRCTTYGTVIGNMRGVKVDPGGTANTLGTRIDIDAATANRIRVFYVYCGGRTSSATSNTTDNNALLMLDLGAAASEKSILPIGIHYAMSGNGDTWIPAVAGPFLVDIPAGTRISAQAQADIITANVRELNIIILGLD